MAFARYFHMMPSVAVLDDVNESTSALDNEELVHPTLLRVGLLPATRVGRLRYRPPAAFSAARERA